MTVGRIILDRNKEIFILYGETGEYDDYRSWVVGAFYKELNATEYMSILRHNALINDIPVDASAIVRSPVPLDLIDKGLETNWVGYGVEYSIGKISIMDDEVKK